MRSIGWIGSTGRGESMTTFMAAQRMPSAWAAIMASRHSPKVEPQARMPTSTGPSSPKRLQMLRSPCACAPLSFSWRLALIRVCISALSLGRPSSLCSRPVTVCMPPSSPGTARGLTKSSVTAKRR